MNRKFRIAGWLAVSALLAAAILAPASVFATDLHGSQQGTSWNDPEFQSNDCGGLKLEPGQVAWHFVLTSPQGDSGHITATFQKAGAITVANTDSPSAVLHFWVITGHDTLLDAATTDVDGRNLNLSHICACGDKASQSAPAETASAPVETETAPAETQPAETQPAETETARRNGARTETETGLDRPRRDAAPETEPVETATAPVETATVPAETASAPVETATGSCRDRERFPPRPRPSRRKAKAPPRALSSIRSARTVRRTRARAARSTRRPARRTRESRLRRQTPSRTRPIRRTAAGS